MGKIAFPRHVYKKDGPIKWNRGLTYSREYVTNEAEYKAALKTGFIDDFNKALLGESKVLEGSFEEVPTKEEVTEEPITVNAKIDDDF